jgi:hypothetical protein
MADRLRVGLRDILYRTRGRDWDYGFLLQPPPILGEGWYALHRSIFANVEPGPVPLLLRGALGVGTGHPFFATVFADATRRDYQDRPVAHYLIWLGPSAEAAPGSSFGPPLVQALSTALGDVFELNPEWLRRGESKPLDTLLRERFQAALPRADVIIEAETAGSPIRWLGTLAR